MWDLFVFQTLMTALVTCASTAPVGTVLPATHVTATRDSLANTAQLVSNVSFFNEHLCDIIDTHVQTGGYDVHRMSYTLVYDLYRRAVLPQILTNASTTIA